MSLRRKTPLQAKPKPCCGRSLCSCGEPPKLARTPIKPNPKRKAKKFAENYHSSAFVEWIHGWPCSVCGVTGWSEAAHIKRRSQGGKAEDNIAPLCGTRTYDGPPPHTVKGCHQKLDEYELEDERMRLKAMAKALWKMWQLKTAVDDTE